MKGVLDLCLLVLIQLSFTQVECQRSSPCPNVFTYDRQASYETSNDEWYGTIKLQSSVQLYGITLDFILDRKASDFSAHHFSEASTSDYIEFRVENKNLQLTPGRILEIAVTVKYRNNYVPLVKQIRLNGQNVCIDLPTVVVQPVYRPSIDSSNNNAGNSQYDSNYDTTRKTTRRENPNNNNNYNYNNFETTTKRTTSQPSWNEYANSNNNFNSNSNNNQGSRDNNYGSNVSSYTTQRPNTQRPNNSNNNRPQSTNQSPSYDNYNPSRDSTSITFVSDPYDTNNFNSRPNNQQRPTTTTRTTTHGINYFNNFDTTTRRQTHFQGDLPFINRESTTHSILNLDDGDDQCGTVIAKTNPLIVHGLETYAGAFPWHSAIYYSDIGNLKYICGGSLISMSAVLTAAHCVTHQKTSRAISADKLLVYLGKHNLQKWTGQEQDGKVVEIVVHNEFDPERFYSDIAILKLKDALHKTNYVRPVCVWKFDSDIRGIVDKLGSVPGWGYNENGLVSDDLSYIKMPVVTHETCIWSNRDFFSKVTSEKSFCAGFRNGTNVCNGDSGGGIVFKQANKWYLRGVVSVSIALQNSVRCDPDHYAVFVDVAKYTSWIDRNI